MKIYSVYLTYKNIKRLREILAVFFKYGFSNLIENTELKRFIPFYQRYFRKKTERFIEGGTELQFRKALEELGPTFIKFGQMLSRRRDLISESLAAELSRLEDNVTPIPYEQIIGVFKNSRIKKDTVKQIEKTPIASASIAQVYKAKLKDGKDIVIKIKRPNVEEPIKNDLKLLSFLGSFLDRHFDEIRYINLPELIEEFSRILLKELDFRNEYANMVKVKKTFSDIDFIIIPEPIFYMSDQDVLGMELVESIKITEKDRILSLPFDAKKLVLDTFKIFVKKVLETGVYHGDLHPGNMGITVDGKVVLYDFGNIGFLSTRMRLIIKKLFNAIIQKDYENFAKELLELGLIKENVDLYLVERDLIDAFEKRFDISLNMIDLSNLIKDIIDISRKYSIFLPSELVGFFRTLILIESVGKEYIEDFSLNNLIYDFFKEADWMKEFLDDYLREAKQIKDMVTALPYRVDKILKKMVNDTFTVDFVHKNLEPLIDETKKSSTRISLSLIISALIVGSSIVFFSDKGPHIFGYPLLGVLGFISSMLLGIYLIISIVRSGRV